MTKRTFPVLGLTLGLTVACGTKTTEPPPPGDPVPDLTPNPDGVLLPGETQSPARDALRPLPPAPANASDVIEGFLTTRLVAIVSPDASVGEVNGALDSANARIVAMSDATPFVTLKIPPVADPAAARAVADALRATGAFLHAAHAHAPIASAIARGPGTHAHGRGGGMPAIGHLEHSRFIAAWNVRRLAATNDDEIAVIVPDDYTSTLPSSEIDAQGFVGFGGVNPLPGPVVYPGNHGYVVSGVIGANVDATPATGTNPYPGDLLDIRSMPLGGYTWNDVFWSIGWQIASGGDRFVLNTGIGYNDPEYQTWTKLDRAMHVIAWRVTAATHEQKFVHVTSAGRPDGDASLNSPFIAAARFDDVRDMVDLDELSSADSLAIETAWADLLQNFPPASGLASNVLVTAAADYAGNLLADSAPGDVQAIGVEVVGPCTDADPGGGSLCDGDVAAYGGTGVAAAQVSGLAAYLMNVTDASPTEIREVIEETASASVSGVIDAYDALFRIDGTETGAIREALLDVAGFQSNESDGDFDEHDLPALTGLNPGTDRAGGGGGEDPFIRRMDLNGDGVVGGASTHRFDLDANGTYGTVTQNAGGQTLTFDEEAVSDFDIVCYYAFSSLYGGDPEVRDNLLVPSHAGIYVAIGEFPERIPAGEPIELTVTAGLPGGENPRPGGEPVMIRIDLDVDNGSADPSSGEVEPGGTFTTMVTLDDDENELFVTAWADLGPDEVSDTVSALREDGIEFVSRYVWVGTEVFSTRCTEIGIPCQEIVYDGNFEQIDDTTDLIDRSYSASAAGSGSGMSVSGEGAATIVSNLDLGTNFSGTTFEGTMDATITLADPNMDIHSYQAQTGAWVEVEVEFNVWGNPAPFALSGTLLGEYYDVELDGPDDDVYVCDNDEPCAGTISTGGELPPGNYELSMYIETQPYIGSGDDTPDQGTFTEDGEIDITFVVNHGGVRLP